MRYLADSNGIASRINQGDILRIPVRRLSENFLCLSSLVSAANNSAILSPNIDAFIANTLAEWNSPGGISVAIVRMDGNGGWLVETKGYGNATVNGTKVTPDTIFAIGSNSKLFDALATGLIVSNDTLKPQISWNTKVASIIPGWKLLDPIASSESTITDLMSHRTGLPSNDFSYFTYNDTIPAMLQRLKYLKPSAGFREFYQYNNMMYAVLSYLPTVLLPHKPSFVRYVTDNIIAPLGMNSTTYSFAEANATGRMADGFAEDTAGSLHPRTYFFENTTLGGLGDSASFSGPGGVLSCATDAVRWLQMLLLNGRHPITNATVIPASVIDTISTGNSIVLGTAPDPELSPVVYGGGVIQGSYRGHVMVEHNGEAPGYFAQITRFPEDGVGIAVMSNDQLGELTTYIIKYRLIDEVFGLDPVDWDSRYKAQVAQAAAAKPTHPPANASIPLPFASLAGMYRNFGYGPDIAVCAPSASSSSCKPLLARLNSTFPTELAAADLIWEWDRLTATYISLQHFDGALFNVSGWVAIPTGNASAPFWATDSELQGNVAEFDIANGKVSGFGMRGGISQPAPAVPPPQGPTVEDRSEIWFDAVGR
ncbi:beta-lactamase/transpeptidase-like protein [Mycena vitilis]|nr:beta-lactamase/transpeptidase-like protein [Mycena vitilis]